MKKWKKILIAIVILLAILGAFAYYTLTSAAKLTEYDFGSDKIPSINAIIGVERNVTKVGSGISTNNGQYKEYAYESSSVRDDLSVYSTHLRNNGWKVTKSYDLSVGKGEMQLATESAEKGKILLMSVVFELDNYTINIRKLEGTLTKQQP